MEDVGFAVTTAKVGYYSMVIGEKDVQAEQHYIVGRKPDVN